MTKKKVRAAFGFTLLEVIIVLSLSGLLLSIFCKIYLSAKQLYRDQLDTLELSEEIRFADFSLWQNLIQAGFAGCSNIAQLKLNNHTNIDFKLASNIYGYIGANLPAYLTNKAHADSDALVINKIVNKISKITKPIKIKDSATAISIDQNISLFSVGDVLLLSDCEKGELFLVKAKLRNRIFSQHRLLNSYTTNSAQIAIFEELTFFISDTGRLDDYGRPILSLYFSTNRGKKRELVPGVSRMKIKYSVNQPEIAGINNNYLTAAQISAAGLWPKVKKVRIELQLKNRFLTLEKTISVKLRQGA